MVPGATFPKDMPVEPEPVSDLQPGMLDPFRELKLTPFVTLDRCVYAGR